MSNKKRKSAEIKCRSLSEREKAIYLDEIKSMEAPKTFQIFCLTTKHNNIALKLVKENSELLKEFMI